MRCGGLAFLLIVGVAWAPLQADPLTLRQAIERAVQSSPNIAAAAAMLAGAQSASTVDGRLPNPSIAWIRQGLGAPRTFQPDTTFSVTQSLPLGSRLARARDVARRDVQVGQAGVASARRTVQMQAGSLFLTAVRAAEHERLAVDARDRLTELVRITARQVDAGTAAEGDLRRLEAELTRVGFDVMHVQIQHRQAIRGLCSLLADPVCDVTLIVPPLVSLPPLTGERLAAAVDSHTAVVDATARRDAALARAALSAASATPDLDVTGGYADMQGLRVGVAGASITVPLFNRHRAERQRALAAAVSSEHLFDAARRDARTELESADALARSLETEAARATRLAIEPAEIARLAAETAFREGAGDLLRLLDAQRAFTDTRRDVVDLHFDALHATLTLRLTLDEEIP